MDIPRKITVELDQCLRFAIGLKQLADECGMTQIRYSDIGVTTFIFEDGSSIGCLRAFKEAGLIKK